MLSKLQKLAHQVKQSLSSLTNSDKNNSQDLKAPLISNQLTPQHDNNYKGLPDNFWQEFGNCACNVTSQCYEHSASCEQNDKRAKAKK